MRRGTTPTHTFNTDTDLSSAETVYLTYKQGSKVVLEKRKSDLDITESIIALRLTQKESLAFKTTLPVRIQLRARFPDGTAIASNIINATAEEILKDGEI